MKDGPNIFFLKLKTVLFIMTKHNMQTVGAGPPFHATKQQLNGVKLDVGHLPALGSAVWFCYFGVHSLIHMLCFVIINSVLFNLFFFVFRSFL